MGRLDAVAKGDIRVIIGGGKEPRERIWDLFKTLSEELFVVGEHSSSANVVKLGNNFLLVSMLESLSEPMVLVNKYGVAKNKYMEIVNAFFCSHIYQNYGNMMVEEDFEPAGFKMRLGQKDTNLARTAAEAVGIGLPLADLIDDHFTYGIEKGRGDLDWSALIKAVTDKTQH